MQRGLSDFFVQEATQGVRSLADAFLKQKGLNYFQYARIFSDGTFMPLSNRPDFVEARMLNKRRILSSIKNEQTSIPSYTFLWNENLPIDDCEMARDFDIDNGLCFVQRSPEYYDLIAFAAPRTSTHILSLYAEQSHDLIAFIQQFQNRASSLLGRAQAERIPLSGDLQDVNQTKMLWGKRQRISVQSGKIVATIGWREFESWQLLAHGYTLSETAVYLQLSPRTVETYLDRVKAKLGIERRADLVQKYFLNFPPGVSAHLRT